MPKRIDEEDFRSAIEILTGEMAVIDPHENDTLSSKQISAEQAVIKQESFDRLSSEAKEVIQFILNQPKEVLEILATPKMKLVTKRSIFKHLKKIFRSKIIARQIIKEITEWVNRL